EQMFYATVLRTQSAGWTPALREAYFKWLNMAEEKYTGGASFKLFLQHIRENAVKTLTPEEHKSLASVITPPVAAAPTVAKSDAKPRTLVRRWTMEDLNARVGEADHGRSFENGKAAFE